MSYSTSLKCAEGARRLFRRMKSTTGLERVLCHKRAWAFTTEMACGCHWVGVLARASLDKIIRCPRLLVAQWAGGYRTMTNLGELSRRQVDSACDLVGLLYGWIHWVMRPIKLTSINDVYPWSGRRRRLLEFQASAQWSSASLRGRRDQTRSLGVDFAVIGLPYSVDP